MIIPHSFQLLRLALGMRIEQNSIELSSRIEPEREESLVELAEEVERLARLAYPDVPPEM